MKSKLPTILSAVVAWGLLVGYIGYALYHNHHEVTATSSNSRSAGSQQTSHRTSLTGKVTAVSSSSLTVKNNRTGDTQTFKLTAGTAIREAGDPKTSKDISDGTLVLVWTASDPGAASLVVINPNMDGSARP
jgi:hypothetical protein